MKKLQLADRITRLLVVADLIVFAFALGVSLFIRAQFTNFLVQPIDIAALAPLTVLLRLFTNVIFEHYSLGGSNYLFRDFTSISIHNLLATAVLLALRFLAHVRFFRLPISAIFIEYVFSTFGMFMVRILLSRLAASYGAPSVRYRPRVLVWGEVAELLRSGELRKMIGRKDFVLKGVLSANVMSWDSHQLGLRIFGDESALSDILLNDDGLSAIVIPHPEAVTRKRLRAIFQAAIEHNMQICLDTDSGLEPASEAELLRLSDIRPVEDC